MAKDWEPYQEEIRKLYVLENKSLAEVKRIIEGKSGLIASERAYRDQLKKWGYMKNRTQAFPKPRKKAHTSARSGRRPVPSLLTPEVFGVLQGEASLPRSLPASSSFDPSHNDLNLATPHLSPAGVPEYQSDGLDQDTQAPGSLQFDQNAQDEQGRTQLHRAALDKDIEQVRLLLNAGAAVDVRDLAGNTPLHNGVTAESIEIVLLILRFGPDVDAKNHQGCTPLHLAISQPGIVNALADNGAELSLQDGNGNTPLHLAILNSPPGRWTYTHSSVEVLIKLGANPNQVNNAEVTPFLQLLDRGTYETAELGVICSLLEAGGSVDQTMPDGRTPFQIFLSRSQYYGFKSRGFEHRLENTILRHFLGKGASVVTPISNPGSLEDSLILKYCNRLHGYYSGKEMDKTLVKELFKRITADEARKVGNLLLRTFVKDLDWQMMEGVGKLVRILLRHGVNPNHENLIGETPLILLSEHSSSGTTDILISLLEHGADPWQRDYSGTCALFRTAENGSKKLCRIMFEDDLRRLRSTPASGTERRDATRSQLWGKWEEVARAADWSAPQQCPLPQSEDLSEAAKKILRDCAFGILAENHIRLAKDKFRGEAAETELRRKYVAGIIRDCRELDITVDTSCMDYLIELCL